MFHFKGRKRTRGAILEEEEEEDADENESESEAPTAKKTATENGAEPTTSTRPKRGNKKVPIS